MGQQDVAFLLSQASCYITFHKNYGVDKNGGPTICDMSKNLWLSVMGMLPVNNLRHV